MTFAPIIKQSQKKKDMQQNTQLLTCPDDVGFIETEGEMERIRLLTQEQIVAQVPAQSAKKRFDLRLGSGIQNYYVDYTRDGRNLVMAGAKGHVAAIEWETGKLKCEIEIGEKIRDACWLMNESLFALAQNRFVYIYDGASGAEVHRLKRHTEVDYLEYLPYHFLLSSIGGQGTLRYQDISTGAIVGEIATRMGRCSSLSLNPANGILHLGFVGGHVALHSPTVPGPLVTMQCHLAPVSALSIEPQGRWMATASVDGAVRLWDLRTYRKLCEVHPGTKRITSIAISQRGSIIATSSGSHVVTWRTDNLFSLGKSSNFDCEYSSDACSTDSKMDKNSTNISRKKNQLSPYLKHTVAGEAISSLSFCPFDDVLGVGHSAGFSSLLIPGAGEPNYDSYEANPAAGRSQKREAAVRQVLEKLPAETIMLDPSLIGLVARTEEQRTAIKNEIAFRANNPEDAEPTDAQVRQKRKAARKMKNSSKRSNVIDHNTFIDKNDKKKSDIIVLKNGIPIQETRQPANRTALDRFKTVTP